MRLWLCAAGAGGECADHKPAHRLPFASRVMFMICAN
jgi:hypothetical protein